MKKTRIIALLLVLLSLAALMLLASCKKEEQTDCDLGVHTWGKWQITEQSTCFTNAMKRRKCTLCSETETMEDVGSMMPHTYSTESFVPNGDADCVNDGTKTGVCAFCKQESKTVVDEGSALGHNYGRNPISYENGYKVYKCLRENCGLTMTVDDGTIDFDFEKLEKFENDTKASVPSGATVTLSGEAGEKYLSISRDNKAYIGSNGFGITFTPDYTLYRNNKYVFEFDLLISETTGDMDILVGKKNGIESVFAYYDSETQAIVAGGKTICYMPANTWIKFAFVLDDFNKAYDVYVNTQLVGSQILYANGSSYYYATELEGLSVRMANEPKKASSFGIDNVKTYAASQPNKVGYPLVSENRLGKVTMTLQGNTVSATVSYEKKPLDDICTHAFVTKTVAPDCVSVGYSVKVCGKCQGIELIADSGVASLGHDYENYVKLATCTEDGYYAIRCKTCGDRGGEKDTVIIPALGHSPVVNPHDPNYKYYQVVPATCSTKGYTVFYCYICETVYEDDEKPVLGHKWEHDPLSEQNSSSTCLINGQKVYICTNPDCGEQKIEELPLTEHDKQVFDVEEATCQSVGIKTFWCTYECGTSFDPEELPIVDHKFSEVPDTVPPSCTEPGSESYRCLWCTEANTTEIPALGHLPKQGTDPDADGYEEGYTVSKTDASCRSGAYYTHSCVRCRVDYYVAIESEPQLPHIYKQGTDPDAPGYEEGYELVPTAPTCTDKGYTMRVCYMCEELIPTEEVPANGHTPMQNTDPDAPGYDAEYIPSEPVAPTCIAKGYTEKYCVVCEEYYEDDFTNKVPHDFSDKENSERYDALDCDTPGVLKVFCCLCETEFIEEEIPAGHIPDDYEPPYISEGSCTEDAYTEYYCYRCGEKYREDVTPAPGHKEINAGLSAGDDGYVDGYAPVVVAPTCIAEGYTKRTCSVCMEDYETDPVPVSTEHSWSTEYVVDSEPTCTVDGTCHYVCTVKGCEEINPGDPIPATGHVSKQGTDPDAPGYEEGYEPNIVIPTCSEAGYTEDVCSVCGEITMIDEVMALGHTPTQGSDPDGKGYVEGYEPIEMVAPTCTEDGYITVVCYVCGAGMNIFGDYPATGHDEDTSATQVIAPTCMAGGYTLKVCKVCGEYKTDSTEKVEHDWVLDEDACRTASCYADGQTVYVCRYADKGCKETNILTSPRTAHDLDGGTVVAPTCYSKGYTEYACRNAGCTYTEQRDQTPETAHDFTGVEGIYVTENSKPACGKAGVLTKYCKYHEYGCTGTETETVPALEHVRDADFEEIVVSPFCTEGGYTVVRCENCESFYRTATIPKTNHKWSEQSDSELSFDSTCYKEGQKYYRCTNEKCTETKIETITKKAHTYGDWENDLQNPPTCTAGGTQIAYCTVIECDAFKTTTRSALGHNTYETGSTATCDTPGVVSYACTRCDFTKTENVGARGHDMIADPENTTVTCTAAGVIATKCSRCPHTDEVSVAALGHSPLTDESDPLYLNTVVPAKCEAQGYTLKYCTRCESEYQDDFTNAIGHKFVEGITFNWIVVTPATCGDDGWQHLACLNGCGKFNDDESIKDPATYGSCKIPATGAHEYPEGAGTVVPPTKDAQGYTYKICTVCDFEWQYDFTEMLTDGTPGLKVNAAGYIYEYTGTATDIVIPSKIGDVIVNGVKAGVFDDVEITSIVFTKDELCSEYFIEDGALAGQSSIEYIVFKGAFTGDDLALSDIFEGDGVVSTVYFGGADFGLEDYVWDEVLLDVEWVWNSTNGQ